MIDNAHYLKFIAGSDFVELNITRSNCSGGSFGLSGIQAGIYSDCNSNTPLAIKCNSFTETLSLTAVVTPGETYLLIIDGQFASVCDYSIAVIDGSTVAPDFSDIQLSINGPEFIQQNGTYTFSTQEIGGADYTWTIYGGDIVEGAGSNEVQVNITSDFYFAVCVDAGSVCSSPTTQICRDYIVDPVVLNEIEVDICEGECYDFNGDSFCQEGTYDRTVNENGTLVDYRIFVSVIPTTQTNLSQTACFGECVTYNGVDYCASGQYVIALESTLGCDSLINLSVEILAENGPAIQATNTGELDCINTSTTLIATSSIAGSSFSWAGPGINDSNANNPSPAVSELGVYTVTATTPQGCTSTATTEVIGIAGDPVVTISGNVPLNCNNAVTNLTATASNTGATFSWTGPDGFLFDGPTVTTDVIGVYEVTATTPSGCTGSKSIIVFANNAPLTVDAGPDRHIQCEFFLDLEANGAAGDDVEYEWTTWNGNILSGANTLSPRINQAGFYTLTATRTADGCSGSTTIQVFSDLAVIENEALEISCAVTSVELDGSNSYMGDDATIQWASATGNIVSGANTLTPTINAPGNYQLIISRPACISFASINVTDNTAAPDINLSASAPVITCNEAISLSAEVNPASSSVAWFKDGIELSSDATITIIEGGTYTLEAIGPNACEASESISIGVEQDPVSVSIDGNLTLDCGLNGVGELFATVVGEDGDYAFHWTATDGGEILSNGSVSDASIFGGGTYCVAVTNQNTGCTITECVSVEEFSSIEFVPTLVNASCPNATDGSIQLEVLGGVPPYAYDWSNGATTESLENIGPGVYSLVLTDANNCNAFQTFIIESSDAAAIIAFAGSNQFYDCATGTLSLNGEASVFPSGSTFQWSTNDGIIDSGANSLTAIVSGPGTYTLTIDNGQGCSDSDEIEVFEYQANAGTDRLINCAEPTVQLNALQNITGASYEWITSDGNIVTGADSPTPTVDAAGTYLLTVTLASGCTYSDEAIVLANFDTPDVSVAATEVALTDCTNPVTISASSSTTGATFSWIGPSGTANGASFSVFDAGTYTVIATAPNGCTNSAIVQVVDESDAPTILSTPVQYINCFNGNPLVLMFGVDGGTGSFDVDWTTDDGNIVNQVGVSIQVSTAGTYTATATDQASGCDASYSILVEERDAEIEVSSTIASCGIADATATVSTNYIHNPSYLWSTGATTASIDGLAPNTYSVTISGGTNSCTEVRTIEVVQESSCFVIVSGSILEDKNCTSADSPMEGVLVSIEPEGLETFTDADGYYEFLVPPGTYTVEPHLISPYVVECPSSSLQVDVPPGSSGSASNNFYTKALSGFDLYLTASSGGAVAGNNQSYQINYCNNWFTTIFGTLEFTHDPNVEFDPVAAGADSYDPSTNTAVFNFTDLSFFECEFKGFSVYIPSNVPHGTVLTTTVNVLPTQGDIAAQNNTVTWTRVVSNGSASSLTDPNVLGNGAANPALEVAGSIEILDQYPNPFRAETTIEFTLEDARDVELQVFDAAGRLVKSYTGYEKGWNKQLINGSDLTGFGVYLYRIVGPEMVASGRMIKK
jgi:hypothetical protein